MRNSNPGVSIVSAQRPNSNLDSMFTMQATGCNFQYGSNFRFPGSILLVVMIHLPLEECIHDRLLHEFVTSLVSLVMKYCAISTTHRNPASIPNLLTLSVCESLSIRSSSRCNRKFRYAVSSLSKRTSVWFDWAKLIVPPPYQVALIYREKIHILHTFPRLLRKDWADFQKRLCEK